MDVALSWREAIDKLDEARGDASNLLIIAADPDGQTPTIETQITPVSDTPYEVGVQCGDAIVRDGKATVTCSFTKDAYREDLWITATDEDGHRTPAQVRLGTRAGDNNKDGDVRVAILGDSFISGEGASTSQEPYLSGSDESGDGGNLCHRTRQSWPIQIAKILGVDTSSDALVSPFGSDYEYLSRYRDEALFAACSGARTYQLTDDGQYTEIAQLKQLRKWNPSTVDAVFLSIGGNDAGFGDVIRKCIWSDCDNIGDVNWPRRQLAALEDVFVKNAQTINAIRQVVPEAEVYVMGYPDPINPIPSDECESRAAGISIPEMAWLHGTFIPSLNRVVEAAASMEGAIYLDSHDLFRDHGICATDPWSNGVRVGDDAWVTGNESFHPNHYGQDEMADFAGGILLSKETRIGSRSVTAPRDSNEQWIAAMVLDGDVVAGSTQGRVVRVQGAEPGTTVVVTHYSVPTIVARGVVDAGGSALLEFTPPSGATPGAHQIEVYDEATGRVLATTSYSLAGVTPCSDYGPDADGDGLHGGCDLDELDGPKADIDKDLKANGVDNCVMVSNSHQADADGDGVGDLCDADMGVNPLDEFRPLGWDPDDPVVQAPVFSSVAPATAGVVGTAYEFKFAASGEPTFTVSGGALPDGLALSGAGMLAGTPSTAGDFSFSVAATNGSGSSTAGPFTISIAPATATSRPVFSSGAPPTSGVAGTAYEFTFAASGEPTFAVSDGVLPDGLVLAETGQLSGTPARAGGFTFSVTATNASGSSVAGPFTVDISTAPPSEPPPVSQPPASQPPAPPGSEPVPVAQPPAPQPPAPPTSVVKVKAVSAGNKLFVNVDPDKGKGYWRFKIQKMAKNGKWITYRKTYKTSGSKETKTLNLTKGTYRVVVLAKYTLASSTSAAVYLRR